MHAFEYSKKPVGNNAHLNYLDHACCSTAGDLYNKD